MGLEQSNFFYRAPEFYDQVQADPEHTAARLCTELIDTHGPADSRTVLDFGCGTGRDLEHLAERFDCVGVDVQPGMVDYARRVRPKLDIRVGDMRSFRISSPVDVVTCLGNSLAYLHNNDDLQAAFGTFAAHAQPGTLLILLTPVAPIAPGEPRAARVDTADLHGEVTIEYEWDLRTQINTMRRHWVFDDGAEAYDRIQRRVLYPRELELHLSLAGFQLIDMFDRPSSRGGSLHGPSAYTIARHG